MYKPELDSNRNNPVRLPSSVPTLYCCYLQIPRSQFPRSMSEGGIMERVDYSLHITAIVSLCSLARHPNGEPFIESPHVKVMQPCFLGN